VFLSACDELAAQPPTTHLKDPPMTHHKDDELAGHELLESALRIELVWLDESAPTPSSGRVPLDSEVDFGLTLTESQYAAGVLDLFEQEGVDDAFEEVIANRLTLSAYRDFGAEPWEVVAHIRTKSR
jgi:hypothetical protein